MNDNKVEAIVTRGNDVVGSALVWIDENGLHIQKMEEK